MCHAICCFHKSLICVRCYSQVIIHKNRFIESRHRFKTALKNMSIYRKIDAQPILNNIDSFGGQKKKRLGESDGQKKLILIY